MLSRMSPLLALAALFGLCTPVAAQRNVARRVERLLDQPPFERASWGVFVMDTTGRVVYAHSPDRLFIPASNTKLVVTAAASALLPPDHRALTRLHGLGPLGADGVLAGGLVISGSGDPTFSDRCYGTDTLALDACDWLWRRMDALADSVVATGVRVIDGPLVADGSFYEPQTVHPAWEVYDLTWWYAAPVTALGFNDNSINIRWGPGPRVGTSPIVDFEPDLHNFLFENRGVTGDSGSSTTLEFYRDDGQRLIWAEGNVASNARRRTEYLALPDPNRYFAEAFRAALARRGVAVTGGTESTTDPTRYATLRETDALVTFASRPVADWIFPILNTSQNWFAEMLLKQLGAIFGGEGSWDAGLAVEARFLIDSVGIDSTAFALSDASGLSAGNLVSPRAFAELLRYMWSHPNRAAFLSALPRSANLGSLRTRFVGTPLEGRVRAKTGSINHVNTLSGYIERERGGPLIFSVMANNRTAGYRETLAQIDSVVVAIGR